MSDAHQLALDQIATRVFCFKADYAEATSTHNTGTANYVDIFYDKNIPPEEDDERIRTTIYGHPAVIFHKKDSAANPVFVGKYNANTDKSSEETFGFTEDYPDVQSVEFCNNTSDACLFHGPIPSDWSDDFEFRYPDGHEDISAFKEMHDWVVSTYQVDATGDELEEVYIGVDGQQYTHDTVEYRLAKFKKEFEDHFDMEYALVYYVYTFFALMVDQRAKNLFLTSWDKKHWMCYFYDNDTIFGINNQGDLVLDYFYEDRDQLGDAYVFNGATSTLWVNFKAAFWDKIKEKYRELRSDKRLSKAKIKEAYITNQADKWCISIYNEDTDYKYISMVRSNNDTSNLGQVRGKGVEHLDYMVDNRLIFCDSLMYAGNDEDYNYPEDYITLRIYTPVDENDNPRTDLVVTPNANITATYFTSMYGGAKYKANGTLLQERVTANIPVTFSPPVNSDTGESEKFNNTETAVFGASQLSSLGDLSALYPGSVKVSKATKLVELIIGCSLEGYVNENLWELEIGTNKLLKKVNICNCPRLVTPLGLSNCPNIQEIYATGSGITGLELPKSGYLKKVYLPGTLTNLTVTNQKYIEEFKLEGYDKLTTLRIEDAVKIPVEDIMLNAPNLNRIRLIDVEWNAESEEALVQTIAKFKACLGLDANGNNTNNAVVTGRVYVAEKVSDEVVGDIYNSFPDLIVDDGSEELYIVNYKDWDGSILYSDRLAEGQNAIDPILNGEIDPPFRASDEYYSYEFIGWNMIPTNVARHYIVTAQYNTKVAINFAVNGQIWYSDYVNYGSNAEDPVAIGKKDPPIKEGTDDLHYVFSGWDGSLLSITMPRTVNALFSNVYPVRFYATETSSTPHYVQWVKEGENAYDPSTDEGYTTPLEIMVSKDEKLVFSHWNEYPTNVTGICRVDANYDTYWTVRFMNEPIHNLGHTKEVDLQWIPNGGSAVDRVDYNETGDENKIPKPAKKETAEFYFHFSGWKCDDIEEDIFENITTPRVLKAVYRNETRKYNVEFYNLQDGREILLWTHENVLYGSNATDPVASGIISTPIKLGVEDSTQYDFRGWNPSYKNIQGPTKCYAIFRYNDYIQDDWATIAANANSGNLYPIGARKIIPLTLDGVDYTVDVEIIAHYHDYIANDSMEPVAFTFLCKELPDFKRKMYESHVNTGGWPDSDMRKFVNGELFEALPEELKNVIKPVYKISDGGANSKKLITTVDSCWIPSYDEVGFAMNRTDNLEGQGKIYSDTFGYGADGNSTRIKYTSDGYTPGRWWLRTTSYGDSVFFFRILNSGGPHPDNLYYEYNVAFGFCV